MAEPPMGEARPNLHALPSLGQLRSLMAVAFYVACWHHRDGPVVFLRYVLPAAIVVLAINAFSRWLDNQH